MTCTKCGKVFNGDNPVVAMFSVDPTIRAMCMECAEQVFDKEKTTDGREDA